MQTLLEKVTPINTALIVIDIQNDFASPDTRFFRAGRGGDLSMVDPMVDKLERMIPIAERVGVSVFYTQQIYDRKKLNELQKEQYDLDGKLVTCDINTDGYKFYRIKPPKEKVYPKYNFNIFSNTDLLSALKIKNIKSLVLTGMDIIYCVETAIRNGYDLGYRIILPIDMVAGNAKAQEANKRTFDLVQKTYGVLTTYVELLEIWTN